MSHVNIETRALKCIPHFVNYSLSSCFYTQVVMYLIDIVRVRPRSVNSVELTDLREI